MNYNDYTDTKTMHGAHKFGMKHLKKKLYMVALLDSLFRLVTACAIGIVVLHYLILLSGNGITVPYEAVELTQYIFGLKGLLSLIVIAALVYSIARYFYYTHRLVKSYLDSYKFTFITEYEIGNILPSDYDKVLSLSVFEVYRTWRKILKDNNIDNISVKLNIAG